MVNARQRKPASQRGNALMVSLVFLVILTTLGVSVAGTGQLETDDGGQHPVRQPGLPSRGVGYRFRPAYPCKHAAEQYGDDPQKLLLQPDDGGRSFDDPATPALTYFAEKANTTTTYEEVGNVPDGGYSMGVDDSIVAHHFAIDSRSESQRRGQAGHEQGIYIVGPGGK